MKRAFKHRQKHGILRFLVARTAASLSSQQAQASDVFMGRGVVLDELGMLFSETKSRAVDH